MSDWLPVQLITGDAQLKQELQPILADRYPFRFMEQVPAEGPSILLLDCRENPAAALSRASALAEGHPERAVVLVGWSGEPGRVLETGCRGWLPLPLGRETVLSVLRRMRLLLEPAARSPELTPAPRILVMGARGGVGKSLLCASLLALHAQRQRQERGLYVDLSLPSRASQVMLNLEVEHSLLEVGRLESGASEEAIRGACARVEQAEPAETYYLPGAVDVAELDQLGRRPELVIPALQQLGRTHRLLIIEAGQQSWPLCTHLYGEAGLCLFLLPPDVPGLRQGEEMVRRLEEDQSLQTPLVPILNLGLPSRGIGPEEARLLMGERLRVLPACPQLQDAANRGLPLKPPHEGLWVELVQRMESLGASAGAAA